MAHFDYKNTPFADGMREDIAPAYRAAWELISKPGIEWTGAEQIAIIAESRKALDCNACKELKSALSPYAFKGKHESPQGFEGVLPAVAVDVIHRIVVDQSRFSKKVRDDFLEAGLTEEHYIELLSVVVIALALDDFNRGLSLPLEALPTPLAGEPSHYRIPEDRLDRETTFIPMIKRDGTIGAEGDLWDKDDPSEANNVLRALSVAPDLSRVALSLGGAQYWLYEHKYEMDRLEERVLNRTQIELVASRVSAHNECFY